MRLVYRKSTRIDSWVLWWLDVAALLAAILYSYASFFAVPVLRREQPLADVEVLSLEPLLDFRPSVREDSLHLRPSCGSCGNRIDSISVLPQSDVSHTLSLLV